MHFSFRIKSSIIVVFFTLVAEYNDSIGVGFNPDADDTLMIAPAFFSDIAGNMIRVIFKKRKNSPYSGTCILRPLSFATPCPMWPYFLTPIIFTVLNLCFKTTLSYVTRDN